MGYEDIKTLAEALKTLNEAFNLHSYNGDKYNIIRNRLLDKMIDLLR